MLQVPVPFSRLACPSAGCAWQAFSPTACWSPCAPTARWRMNYAVPVPFTWTQNAHLCASERVAVLQEAGTVARRNIRFLRCSQLLGTVHLQRTEALLTSGSSIWSGLSCSPLFLGKHTSHEAEFDHYHSTRTKMHAPHGRTSPFILPISTLRAMQL